MNNTTSISYNNSPYTIQSTSANGTSISYQVNPNIIKTNPIPNKQNSNKHRVNIRKGK